MSLQYLCKEQETELSSQIEIPYYTNNKTEPLCFYCGSEDIDSSKDFCDCYPMCNQCIASKRPPVLKRKRAVSAGGSGGPSSKRHKS